MSNSTDYPHLFGPVPSRRLGRSLGVDLVPFKTCSLNCVYCQLGPTTELTIQRAPYVPAAAVIADLEAWLDRDGEADFITLAGSGEPTLNSQIGQVIDFIKANTQIPVCVLTNGTLFADAQTRRDCLGAELIVPSVDAGTAATFRRVNHPAAGLEFEPMIDGLIALRKEFAGDIWVETLLVKGVNDSDAELSAIRSICDRIRPDQIQVNTVVRPSGTARVEAVLPEGLRRACEILGPKAVVIAPLDDEFAGVEGAAVTSASIMALLSRRPCTLDDISVGLAVHRNELVKYLTQMLAEGVVRTIERDGSTYYEITRHE